MRSRDGACSYSRRCRVPPRRRRGRGVRSRPGHLSFFVPFRSGWLNRLVSKQRSPRRLRGCVLSWSAGGSFVGDDGAVLEDVAAPDSAGFCSFECGCEALVSDGAVLAKGFGVVEFCGDAGEPQVGVFAVLAGQFPCGLVGESLASVAGRRVWLVRLIHTCVHRCWVLRWSFCRRFRAVRACGASGSALQLLAFPRPVRGPMGHCGGKNRHR